MAEDIVVVVEVLFVLEIPKKLSIVCFDKVKFICMHKLKCINKSILGSFIIYELNNDIFLIKLSILKSFK